MTIRRKLILTFMSIIIIPIVTTILSGTILLSNLQRNYDLEQLDKLQYLSTEVRDFVTNEYSLLISEQGSTEFSNRLEGLLSDYDIELKIIADTGEILYDSRKYEEFQRQVAFFTRNFSQNTIIVPLPDYNTQIRVEVYFDPESTPSQIFYGLMKVSVTSLALGFLSLVLAIAGFTWFISRSILKPLEELNRGTEKVYNGDFNFYINYSKDDEFGRLCQSFTLMKNRLKASLEKQEEDERLRKQLVANISHDIRTPVASIKGYVEGIQDGIAKDPQQLKRYLSVIHGKTEQLDRLVDDLFQYSQLEVGKLEIILQEYDCKHFFESILEPFTLQFESKEIEFNITVDKCDVQILADKQRIIQVMENLIENAGHFINSHTGRIDVIIERQQNNHEIMVTVSDNGRGIKEEDLPFVFDEFFRAEKSRSREYGGTGLGLAICKYIVAAHGGVISINSRLDQGTQVSFTLPIVRQV